MIISYLQTTNDFQAQMFINKDNSYVDLCSSVIPFDKRDKGSLILALISQKKISKLIVQNISMLGRNQINVLNTIDFLINNNVCLVSQSEQLETMDEYGRVKQDTILFLNIFRSLANMEYKNRKEAHR